MREITFSGHRCLETFNVFSLLALQSQALDVMIVYSTKTNTPSKLMSIFPSVSSEKWNIELCLINALHWFWVPGFSLSICLTTQSNISFQSSVLSIRPLSCLLSYCLSRQNSLCWWTLVAVIIFPQSSVFLLSRERIDIWEMWFTHS